MARYLLIAGDNYYPTAGTGDWIATFDKSKDAEAFFKDIQKKRDKWSKYEWYGIVDLETYMSMPSGPIETKIDSSKEFIDLTDMD